MTSPHEFVEAWRSFAARWAALAESDRRGADALVRAAVRAGLPDAEGGAPAAPDPDTLIACEIAVLEAARAMRPRRYARANQDLKVLRDERMDPIEHFCRLGWRWLRNPRPDFDVWWYWTEYLDPTADDINPLLHHVLVGRHAGHTTTPPPPPDRGATAPPTGTPRRVCLYAAYDADGIVDEYVVHYLRELSRHADVFYLADGVMARAELAKLADVTVAAWAIPHARYDFGSFAMLATELVGWDRIEQYDEMLFANDSCYLLRPLDETFARMDRSPAHWWGLQATKMDFARGQGDLAPIPLAEAKRLHSTAEDWNPHYRIHLSSYLLGFRRAVFTDPGFRHRLGSVCKQAYKDLVILKYEIGISDYLIDAGFDFDTFIPDLYPFHPLYSSDYFDLLAQGFPLLKRNFIGETPGTPDLGRWKERVLEHVPDAPVDLFERNLHRVAPADKLARTAQVRTDDDGLVDYRKHLTRREFRLEDRLAPKFDHWWAFPVSATENALTGNERAIFEEVRHDPTIKKVVLTRSLEVDLPGENVAVAPLSSREGQELLTRARYVFVRHDADRTLPWELDLAQHRVIDVAGGTPAAGGAQRPQEALSPRPSRGRRVPRHVVVADLPDGSAGSGDPDVETWTTGQPRHAFLVRPEEELPADLRAELDRLRAELDGRRLVLWLTSGKGAARGVTEQHVAALQDVLERHRAVLGVRSAADAHLLGELDPLLLMPRTWPDVEMLYRAAALLVADERSPHRTDYPLTGRPALLLDADAVADLPAALDRALSSTGQADQQADGRIDGRAAGRVVRRIREASLSDPAAAPAARRPRGRRRGSA